MKIITPKREFIKDEKAVSEEFTSLPALSVVMIGFALFILLVANTYSAYTTRTENLNKYQTADFIATKLTNPDSFIIKEGGIINLPVFKNSEAEINKLRQKYQASGIDFVVIVNYENNQIKQPSNADVLMSDTENRVAVTKNVGVYINTAQTKPGSLTIITWSV